MLLLTLIKAIFEAYLRTESHKKFYVIVAFI